MKNNYFKIMLTGRRFVFFFGGAEEHESLPAPKKEPEPTKDTLPPDVVSEDAKDKADRMVKHGKQKAEELHQGKQKAWADMDEKEREEELVLMSFHDKLHEAHEHIGAQIKSGNRDILKPENMAQTMLDFVGPFYDNLSGEQQKIMRDWKQPVIEALAWKDPDIVNKLFGLWGRRTSRVTFHMWFEGETTTVKAFPPYEE